MKKLSLTATQLQWIAIIGMIADHVGWVFFPDGGIVALILHFIGRLTFPIMGYFIAQGYHYSKNVPKYIGRVFLLAVISIIPFYLMAFSFVGFLQNTVFTLALGLTALYFSGKTKNPVLKTLAVLICTLLSVFADAGISGVLMIYFMGTVTNKKLAVIGGISLMIIIDNLMGFVMASLSNVPFFIGVSDWVFMLGALMAIPLLLSYNGEKGGKNKYLFYIIYPLHLIIIWALSIFII